MTFLFLHTLACLLAVDCTLPVKQLQSSTQPLPGYVLEYAPLSHLWSQESWWPSDIADHLTHVTPHIDYNPVASSIDFQNISRLPMNVFLTSQDAVEQQPEWLFSAENEPNSSRYSGGPATIICVQKGSGIVDAFYFYFYSYNYGGVVLGAGFGNHIGDWEHSMVRFIDGEPAYIYLSAHRGGTVYNYTSLKSTSNRATTYIAGGSHANYATPGDHPHALPLGLLMDHTDAGPLWDITANFRGFWFDNSTRTFTSAGGAGVGGVKQDEEGLGWLSFAGRWGDKQYRLFEHGQYCVGTDACLYVDGPQGPISKKLGRKHVCPWNDCPVLDTLMPSTEFIQDSFLLDIV